MRYLLVSCFILSLLFSCKNKNAAVENIPPTTDGINFTSQYSTYKNKIYKYGIPIQVIGANAFHTFGGGSTDMNSWRVDIVREFVGNVKEQPITGFAIQDANGAYLHSLQEVVDSNRQNNKITILCPFRWNGIGNTNFTGKRPTLTYWYTDLKIKLLQWATHFKTQPDVWIELWNEPYRYDRADGYTDDIWLADMNDLTATIRNTGNKNMVLVPCAEQGQDETVLINKGSTFLSGKTNILFDVHAYEKWLLVSNTAMGNRLQLLKQNNIPMIFGETAPMNAGILMDTKPFLDSIYNRGLSMAAWVWKYNATDQDALLDAVGNPNNNNNNSWGTAYKTLCLKARNP